MSLQERFGRPRVQEATPKQISCLRYEPLPGSRRCKFYLDGGVCALPDEFMCIEWLRVNGHGELPSLPPLTQQVDPFG